jgi:hypothetical protein
MADGRILRCSTCDELAKEFAEELADPKNRGLAEWLKNVQERAAKDPEGVANEIEAIEKELQKFRNSNPKTATEVVNPTPKVKRSGGVSKDIREMMGSQKIAPDLVNKGVHFNVGAIELKLVPSGNTFELEPVFSGYKEAELKNAIGKATPALSDPTFKNWLLKHAEAGLGMAKQGNNTERVEYFKNVIKILQP